MKISIDKNEPLIFTHDFFDPSISCVIALMMRLETKHAIAANISDFDSNTYEEGLKETYTLKLIQQKGEINEFSCIYSDHDPAGIYLNPILLVNNVRETTTSPQVIPSISEVMYFLLM